MLKTPLLLALMLTSLVIVIPTIADELPIINNPPAKQEADQTTDSKENTKTQNPNSTTPLAVINPTPPPPLQEIRENERPKYGKEQKSSWWDFSLTDVLLAIFTCGLVIVGWFQVRILRRTLKVTDGLLVVSQEQSKAMDQSINEAARSAVAMEKVAISMQKSTHAAIENVAIFKDVREKQLRPWVLVDSIYIHNVINPSKTDMMKIPGYKPTGAQIINPMIGPQAMVLIKNSGPTPAINLKHWASICVKEYPLKSDLPVKIDNLAETKATLASQGIITLPLNWPEPLTAEQIIELKKGTIVIYVHGEITYTDIFGINRKTIYRVMHGAMSGILGIYNSVTICEDGNEIN